MYTMCFWINIRQVCSKTKDCGRQNNKINKKVFGGRKTKRHKQIVKITYA